jgi:hypothetical protein
MGSRRFENYDLFPPSCRYGAINSVEVFGVLALQGLLIVIVDERIEILDDLHE